MWKHLAILACTGTLMLGCAGRVNHEDPTFMTSASWIQTCLERMGYQPGRTDGVMDQQSSNAVLAYQQDYVAEEITGMGRSLYNKDTRLDANKLLYTECAKIAGPRSEWTIPVAP